VQKDPEGFERKILHKYAEFTNKRVLELGCGEGRLTWKYAAASNLTVGFDPDHDALRIAQSDMLTHLPEAGRDASQSRGTHVHFAQASAKNIPFAKETFDIAILAWSL
jgi:ubiquinone/menaquinone biosynthesis C-methylase UbiE